MTDNDDIDNIKTPLEMALEAIEEMDNNKDKRDPLTRIFDALSIITMGVKEVTKAASNIRQNKAH